MPNAHPRPWHAGSLFGDGPRRPLDREQRARFRFLLNAHRRAHRITLLGELVGNALVRRLGVGGQCDPSQETIASDVGCCSRTVRRALDAMKTLGLVNLAAAHRAGWLAGCTDLQRLRPGALRSAESARFPCCSLRRTGSPSNP